MEAGQQELADTARALDVSKDSPLAPRTRHESGSTFQS